RQQDIDTLARDPSIAAVTEEVRGQAEVVSGDNDVTVTWDGIPANFFAIRNFALDKGYPFTNDDVNSFNHVAVIGSALADTLFGPNSDPIGQSIRLKNISFRIVGVLAKKDTGAFGIDQDNLVLLPVSVGQKQLLGIEYFNDIVVQANDNYTVDFTKTRVRTILEQNHGITN